MTAASDSSTSGLRGVVFRGVVLLFGVALGVGLVEVWLRLHPPPPPVQVVRNVPRETTLRVLGGVPVWEQQLDRQHRRCAEEFPRRQRVLLIGSSITYGSGLDAEATFTDALERRLNAARPDPGFCVLNFSQPGYGLQQKLAVARVEVARYRPSVVLWEVWHDLTEYVYLGGSAFQLRGFARRADGHPGLAWVPDGLNGFLFDHLWVYQYGTLHYGQRQALRSPEEEFRDFRLVSLAAVLPLARSVGARLAFYTAPPLDRPFREATMTGEASAAAELGREQGVPVYPLQHELADQDYLAVRLDQCCHYNSRGHQVLAGVFERIVLGLLDGPPSPAPP